MRGRHGTARCLTDAEFKAMLKSHPRGVVTRWPVDRSAGNATNDGPVCSRLWLPPGYAYSAIHQISPMTSVRRHEPNVRQPTWLLQPRPLPYIVSTLPIAGSFPTLAACCNWGRRGIRDRVACGPSRHLQSLLVSTKIGARSIRAPKDGREEIIAACHQPAPRADR